MADPSLILLHLPKTAGTTLRGILLWRYRRYAEHIIQLDSDRPLEELQAIPLETRAQAKVVAGHVPFGVHEYFPQGSAYVTVLREPVARVVSSFRWHLRHPRVPFYERLGRDAAGLEEYVSTDIAKEVVENGQTRLIAGLTSEDAPDRDALEIAKKNLQTFVTVGLTERFDESFLLLRKALGWRNPFYLSRNVTRDWTAQIPVSERAVEVIRERNQLDLELYEYASGLLNEAIRRAGRSFQSEMALLKALNKFANAVARPEGAIRRVLRSRLRKADPRIVP